MPGIWVYLEHNDGALESVALELATKGRELASQAREPLCGLLLGSKVANLAEEALSWGFDEILVADHQLLDVYRTDSYFQAASQLLEKERPNIFLLGATSNGRDLAGRLAVRFRTGLTADCTDLKIEKQSDEAEAILIGEVTGFGGGIAALIACRQARPQMATCRPGVFRASKPKEPPWGKVTRFEIVIEPSQIRTEILQTHCEDFSADITKASFLVIGGRGTKGNFKLLQELAELLGGEIAATRVAVDEGWASRELQVGQTGYAVRPKVAVVCGASGATQFTVGLGGAEKIVAINSDPQAPIFENADYCIVGDIFQIVPAFIEKVKKAKVLQSP